MQLTLPECQPRQSCIGVITAGPRGNRYAVNALITALCIAIPPVGCARLSPIIVGDGYFGLGLFCDNRQPEHIQIDHVDVHGVGLLFAKGRLVLGYSKLCYICCDPGLDARLRLTGIEIALGADAHAWAGELNAIHEHQLPPSARTSQEESLP